MFIRRTIAALLCAGLAACGGGSSGGGGPGSTPPPPVAPPPPPPPPPPVYPLTGDRLSDHKFTGSGWRETTHVYNLVPEVTRHDYSKAPVTISYSASDKTYTVEFGDEKAVFGPKDL